MRHKPKSSAHCALHLRHKPKTAQTMPSTCVTNPKQRTLCPALASQTQKQRTLCPALAPQTQKQRTLCPALASQTQKQRTLCLALAPQTQKTAHTMPSIASQTQTMPSTFYLSLFRTLNLLHDRNTSFSRIKLSSIFFLPQITCSPKRARVVSLLIQSVFSLCNDLPLCFVAENKKSKRYNKARAIFQRYKQTRSQRGRTKEKRRTLQSQ